MAKRFRLVTVTLGIEEFNEENSSQRIRAVANDAIDAAKDCAGIVHSREAKVYALSVELVSIVEEPQQ